MSETTTHTWEKRRIGRGFSAIGPGSWGAAGAP